MDLFMCPMTLFVDIERILISWLDSIEYVPKLGRPKSASCIKIVSKKKKKKRDAKKKKKKKMLSMQYRDQTWFFMH